MKKIMLITAVTALISAPAVFAADGAQWGYTGKESPEHWATLSQNLPPVPAKINRPLI